MGNISHPRLLRFRLSSAYYRNMRPDRIARVRIELDGIDPPVWRRVDVRLTTSLRGHYHTAFQPHQGKRRSSGPNQCLQVQFGAVDALANALHPVTRAPRWKAMRWLRTRSHRRGEARLLMPRSHGHGRHAPSAHAESPAPHFPRARYARSPRAVARRAQAAPGRAMRGAHASRG